MKQEFKTGNKVKIGFMTLEVIRWDNPTQQWILKSNKNVMYGFTPYNGIKKLNQGI